MLSYCYQQTLPQEGKDFLTPYLQTLQGEERYRPIDVFLQQNVACSASWGILVTVGHLSGSSNLASCRSSFCPGFEMRVRSAFPPPVTVTHVTHVTPVVLWCSGAPYLEPPWFHCTSSEQGLHARPRTWPCLATAWVKCLGTLGLVCWEPVAKLIISALQSYLFYVYSPTMQHGIL